MADCSVLFTPTNQIIQRCVMNLPSMVLGILTIICLIQVIRGTKHDPHANKSNLFKYLLVGQVAELITFMFDIFFIRVILVPSMIETRAGLVWYWYLNFYGEQSLLYVSSIMEIAATLDCLISVRGATSRFKWLLSQLTFGIVVVVAVVFSFLFNSFIMFQGYIVPNPVNRTIGDSNETHQLTLYRMQYTPFRTSALSLDLLGVQALLRDIAFPAIIITLNLIILIEMKKITQRKMAVMGSSGKSMKRNSLTIAMQAEKKKCAMIVATGINYAVGHCMFAAFNTATATGAIFSSMSWNCVYMIGYVLLFISYGDSFIFYYIFNSQFRKYAIGNFWLVVKPITSLFSIQKLVSSSV